MTVNYMEFQGPGFTLQIPSDWLITSSPQFQTLLVAPVDLQGTRANLAISMRPVKAEVTAEAVAVAAKTTQQQEYPEYQILNERLESERRFRRDYRWHNPEKNASIIQHQVFVVQDQMLMTLTATRPEAVPNGKQLDTTFDTVLASLKMR